MLHISHHHILIIIGTKNNPYPIKGKTNDNHILWAFKDWEGCQRQNKKGADFRSFNFDFNHNDTQCQFMPQAIHEGDCLQFMQLVAIHCTECACSFFVLDEFHAGILQKLHREFIGVGVLVDDTFDSAVDDDACADCAGLVGDIDCCAIN